MYDIAMNYHFIKVKIIILILNNKHIILVHHQLNIYAIHILR